MNGLLISLEGPDGAGKTTQLKRIGMWLERAGIAYITTREPGGTAIGDHVRQLLLDPANRDMAKQTEVMLYAASRAQLVNEVIRPALAAGKVVLCDRFVDASLAYQGYGLAYQIADIRMINAFATGGLQPHRTYLLDLPVSEGLDRVHTKRNVGSDRIEQRAVHYHDRVRQGFLALAKREPDRFCIVDARQDETGVFLHIQSDLARMLSTGGKRS